MAKKITGRGDERYQGLESQHYSKNESNLDFESEKPQVESLIKTYINGGTSAYNAQKNRGHSSKQNNKQNEQANHGMLK